MPGSHHVVRDHGAEQGLHRADKAECKARSEDVGEESRQIGVPHHPHELQGSVRFRPPEAYVPDDRSQCPYAGCGFEEVVHRGSCREPDKRGRDRLDESAGKKQGGQGGDADQNRQGLYQGGIVYEREEGRFPAQSEKRLDLRGDEDERDPVHESRFDRVGDVFDQVAQAERSEKDLDRAGNQDTQRRQADDEREAGRDIDDFQFCGHSRDK